LYSLYSIPNLFLPLLGGLLVDKFGNRWLLLITATAVTSGQLAFTVGIFFKSSIFAYLGRFILGLGGETLGVVQSSITYNWFADKELGLAIGINIFVGRLGSVLNDILTPWLGNIGGVTFSSSVGTVVCFLSLVSAIILSRIERFYPAAPATCSATESPEKFSFQVFTRGYWLLCSLIILIEGPSKDDELRSVVTNRIFPCLIFSGPF
jgi:MFS family permease